jgi:hypothetical protein
MCAGVCYTYDYENAQILSANQELLLRVIVQLVSPIAAFRLCILAVYLSLSEREVR